MSFKKEKMSKAYKVAQEMLKDRLKDVDESMAKEFDQINDSDVVIVRGMYDYIEQVFDGIGLKYRLVDPEQLALVKLSPEQIVFINCCNCNGI